VAKGVISRRNGMREVALAAGVSVSTVANVLSRPAIVAAPTRERVERAIGELGYVPSGPARLLRGQPSPVVGSLILDLANPFYAELNRGIEDRLSESGCVVLACSTDQRPERERQLLSLLEEQGVRGVIVSPAEAEPTALLELSRRGTPVVLIDRPRGQLDLCAVAVDHLHGGRLVAEHLLELGHRRIAYLGAEIESDRLNLRREGLRQVLDDAGLDPAEALVDLRVPMLPPSVMDAAMGAVERILAIEPMPTALVAVNDLAALGVLHGLAGAGVRVPQDLSVVGYDDLPFAPRLAPALTTVRQPRYELGRSAADLLLEEAHPGHVHREIRFQPSLVVRSSADAPRPGPGRLVPGGRDLGPTGGDRR
jgi:LacI family transcriptional regulator